MSELGLRLKKAREEKGLTLDELQAKTKIQKRYLAAIEDGDYSRLPGDFYARAFVKNYADAVGVDSDLLFEEHRDELPKTRQETVELPPRISRTKPKVIKKKSKLSSFLPTFVVAIFIIAIIGVIWYTGQDGENNSSGISRQDIQSDPSIDNSSTIDDNLNESAAEGEVSNEGNENTENENNEVVDEPEPEPEPILEYVETEGTRSYFTLTNTDSFHVTMSFSGQSWVRIMDEAGDRLHERTYQNGDETTFDFSDQNEVTFHLGSSRTAEIYVNEEHIEYPIDSTVQYIIIDFESTNANNE